MKKKTEGKRDVYEGIEVGERERERESEGKQERKEERKIRKHACNEDSGDALNREQDNGKEDHSDSV